MVASLLALANIFWVCYSIGFFGGSGRLGIVGAKSSGEVPTPVYFNNAANVRFGYQSILWIHVRQATKAARDWIDIDICGLDVWRRRHKSHQ
jgi:hypothetical protein